MPGLFANYPGVSTICRWKATNNARMMENSRYEVSAQQGQGQKKGVSLMSAEESKAIVRQFWGVWDEGNIGLVDELLASDYVNHSPGIPDQPEGSDGVRAVVAMFRSGMPDLRVIIEDMIAEGDKVATRYTLEGTHEGELFGIPPTGQHLSIKSISVERVSDSKIREHWRITDTLDMMQQLGVIPLPEHA